MKKYFLSMYKFERLWLILPALLFILYVPQAIIGIYIFHDESAHELAGVVVLGLVVYIFTFSGLTRFNIQKPSCMKKLALKETSTDFVVMAITLGYFIVILYAVMTSEKVALWEALSGASADEIAFARESLFKFRLGWEKILPYANAAFSSALMPFVLAICYIEKKSYRHVFLLMFVVSLLPSLEKVLILKALLPLVVLGLNGYFPKMRVIQIAAATCVVIFSALFLTKMGAIDPSIQIQTNREQLQSHQVLLNEMSKDAKEKVDAFFLKLELYKKEKSNKVDAERLWVQSQIDFYGSRLPKQILSEEEGIRLQLERLKLEEGKLEKYYIFGPGRLMFILNRIFWIPYVTAYDWLGFFHEKLEGNYLFGKTSAFLAGIGGEVKFPMEREVFKYQFGASGPQTAAANASFLVDAFVNFGWLGVVVYAALFATLTWIVVVQANPAMMACYYYFVFQVSMGGLSGVLFSNGMLLLICVSFFIRPKLNVVAH